VGLHAALMFRLSAPEPRTEASPPQLLGSRRPWSKVKLAGSWRGSLSPAAHHYAPCMRRSLKPLIVSILTIIALCDLAAPASASGHRTAEQGTGSSPPFIVLPVISCKTTYGAGSSGEPFVARQLAASASAKGLSFYSNGLMTVLGPSGWACEALVAADGGQKLDVFPPGSADYSQSIAPKGASLVEVQGEYTGHIPGADLVCALFPHSAAASFASSGGETCPPMSPAEKTKQLTSDVVAFSDPPGAVGTGTGSGGSLTSIGAVVYPQLAFADPSSVNISLLSCTMAKKIAPLCVPIEADFLTRNPPTYVPQTS